MNYTLEPHQERVIEYGLKHPYSIFAVDPGGGKTLISLHLQDILKLRTLVVCPAYLIGNWVSEIKKFFPNKVVTQIKKGSDIYDVWDSDIVLISYSLCRKAPQFFQWCDMLILEEGHEIKTMEAKTTTHIHKEVYENSIKRVHILSGTPVKNRVSEYFSLITLCNYNPEIKNSRFLEKFPDSISFADYFAYRREFLVPVQKRFAKVIQWKGLKNEDELREELQNIYIRIADTEFMKTRPISYIDAEFELRDMPELEKEFQYFEENESVKSDIKRNAAILKVPLTVKYVRENLKEEKVVIFTDHIEPCEFLAGELGVTPITGKMNPTKRLQLASKFQEDPEIKYIVATVGALSEGVNLFAANNLVFNDFPWVPGDKRQCEKRIDRIGQKRHCKVHHIIGSFQDRYILKTLQEKMSVISRIT